MMKRSEIPPASGSTRIVAHPWPAGEGDGEEAAVKEALASGAVMAYPTETFHALGGNALRPALAEAVRRLKGRPAGKALPLLIDGSRGPEPWAREVTPPARALLERFWPGPLTLVFRAGARLPPHLADERGTVALRWSPHPLIAELLRLGGAPLIGTSANASGGPSPSTLAEVLAVFPAGIALALDHRLDHRLEGGPTRSAAGPLLPSSLLDTTVEPFRLLREGAVGLEALREVHPGVEPG